MAGSRTGRTDARIADQPRRVPSRAPDPTAPPVPAAPPPRGTCRRSPQGTPAPPSQPLASAMPRQVWNSSISTVAPVTVRRACVSSSPGCRPRHGRRAGSTSVTMSKYATWNSPTPKPCNAIAPASSGMFGVASARADQHLTDRHGGRADHREQPWRVYVPPAARRAAPPRRCRQASRPAADPCVCAVSPPKRLR